MEWIQTLTVIGGNIALVGALATLVIWAVIEPLSPKGERFLLHRFSNEISPQAFNVRQSLPRRSLGYRDESILME